MPGNTATALPYGLRKVLLKPVNPDGTLGTAVALPVGQKFTFSEVEAHDDLRGDDQVVAAHGNGPLVEWKLEAGGVTLAAWQVLTGGTLTTSGTTPATKTTFAKKTTDIRPYFQVEGQMISDSGGDLHAVVYRCKVTGNLEGDFVNSAFFITNASGKGYGDTVGATPTGNLYNIVQNETAIAPT